MSMDLRLTLFIVLVFLLFGTVINLTMLMTALTQWWDLYHRAHEGPQMVLARALVRRIGMRLIIFSTMDEQIAARLAFGSSPAWRAIVATLIILATLLGDSIGDMFDNRLLRSMWSD